MWIIYSAGKSLVHQKTFKLDDFRACAKRVVAVLHILDKQVLLLYAFFLPTVIPSVSVGEMRRSRMFSLQGRGTICGL